MGNSTQNWTWVVKSTFFVYRLANTQTKYNIVSGIWGIRNDIYYMKTVSNIRKTKVVYKIVIS